MLKIPKKISKNVFFNIFFEIFSIFYKKNNIFLFLEFLAFFQKTGFHFFEILVFFIKKMKIFSIKFSKIPKNLYFFENFSIKFSKISKKCFNFLEILALNFRNFSKKISKNLDLACSASRGYNREIAVSFLAQGEQEKVDAERTGVLRAQRDTPWETEKSVWRTTVKLDYWSWNEEVVLRNSNNRCEGRFCQKETPKCRSFKAQRI